MNYFQFIVLICAGVITILAAVSIIAAAAVKKNSNEIKKPCIEKFDELEANLKESDINAKEKSDRVLTLEVKFAEIISRLTRLEGIMDKNTELTSMVYAYIQKSRNNGDKLNK